MSRFDGIAGSGRGLVRGMASEGSAHRDDEASALVLIAEDEAPIAEVLAMIVEEAGYVPLVAAHGRRALELARERRPALLITDLMMPQLSGAELIAALRADTANGCAHIPVILTTAARLPSYDHIVVDAYLRKPFDIAEVEALLHRFLATQPGADAAGRAGRCDTGVASDTRDTRDTSDAPKGQ